MSQFTFLVRDNPEIASFVQEIASFRAASGCRANTPLTPSVGITQESPQRPRQRWDFARQRTFFAHRGNGRFHILVGKMPTEQTSQATHAKIASQPSREQWSDTFLRKSPRKSPANAFCVGSWARSHLIFSITRPIFRRNAGIETKNSYPT
jgi:hypothetical protein